IRDRNVTGVQTCALPLSPAPLCAAPAGRPEGPFCAKHTLKCTNKRPADARRSRRPPAFSFCLLPRQHSRPDGTNKKSRKTFRSYGIFWCTKAIHIRTFFLCHGFSGLVKRNGLRPFFVVEGNQHFIV